MAILRDDIHLQLKWKRDILFPVFSAFNGVAIYRLISTLGCSYIGYNTDGEVKIASMSLSTVV
jgi:hypothetical protein